MVSTIKGQGGAAWVEPLLYGALNIASASGIVFANKAVFTTYGFKFTSALTWIHTICTLVGMRLFLMAGMFKHKKLPQLQLLPLAAAYVGYIVLCNLSLNVNTVGFYQVMKVGAWAHSSRRAARPYQHRFCPCATFPCALYELQHRVCL